MIERGWKRRAGTRERRQADLAPSRAEAGGAYSVVPTEDHQSAAISTSWLNSVETHEVLPMPALEPCAGTPTWRDESERRCGRLSSRHLLVRVHAAKRRILFRIDPRDRRRRGTWQGRGWQIGREALGGGR